MTTELTFDQLQAISGGATAYEYGLMGFAPIPVEYAATLKTVKADLDKSSPKFSTAGPKGIVLRNGYDCENYGTCS